MSRRYRTSGVGTGRLTAWWPVLLSLLVVLVPTVCVLWFMAKAVENRRLVVRRVLADTDFIIARERLEGYWRQQAAELEKSWGKGEPGSKAFQRCVLGKLADSVVCYGADEKPVYPAPAQVPPASAAEQETREYLQLVAQENTRLSRLIDNFLAFSRMERNKHAFELSEVSAAEVVEAAVETVGERFQSPGCRLRVDISPDLPPLTADADALVTVLLNLLDNAYKYSRDEKQIGLRAYARDGNVCFEVTDNGIGLSRTAAKKVFKRFYQVDRRLSREAGGVGLGLSIVQFIVHAHGGTVGVTSQPGQGSTFTVVLPAASAGAQTRGETA